MRSTKTIEKSIVTIGREKVSVYQNKETADFIASQYQYLLRSFKGPFDDHQIQRPAEVEADSIKTMSVLGALQEGIIKGKIPEKYLMGYVVIIDYLEYCNETEFDYRHKLCLDFFIQERCHKRLYPICMRKNEAFIQWSKYQDGFDFYLPIQRKTMQIIDSNTWAIKDLAIYLPHLKEKIATITKHGYTNVITYKYIDADDDTVYEEILPILLEKQFAERFSYYTQF